MSESTSKKNEDNNGHLVQEEIEEISESTSASSTQTQSSSSQTPTPSPSPRKENKHKPPSHDLSQRKSPNRPPSASASKMAATTTAKRAASASSGKQKKNENGVAIDQPYSKVKGQHSDLRNSTSTPTPLPPPPQVTHSISQDAKERSRSKGAGVDSGNGGKSQNSEPKKKVNTIRNSSHGDVPEILNVKVPENNSIPEEDGKGAKGKGKTGDKLSRLSVTVLGSPFESGANTECIQLLRQLWNVHEEAVQFLGQLRTALSQFRRDLRSQENLFESSLREKRNSNATSTGNLATAAISGGGMSEQGADKVDGWIPLQTFIDGLKCISDSFSDIEKQFITLSVFQMQCKLALFAKVKHAKLQVTQDRLSIMHGIQQFITVSLNLLASPSWWQHTGEEKLVYVVQNIFQLTEVYNSIQTWSQAGELTLENVTASPDEVPPPPPPLGTTEPPAEDLTKPSSSNTSSVHVLVQINAANRNDSALLKLSLKPLSGTRLLHIMAQKRSTFASHALSKILLANFYTNPVGLLSPDKFEQCFTDEDVGLSPLGKGFSQCPSLLGRAAVKKTENGDQRLSRSTRTKMYSYFHQVLWTLTGEHAEELLLWGTNATVPLVLQPLDTLVTLRNTISLSVGLHFQESNLSPMLSAFDSVSTSLHAFSLLANWDEKMREAFNEMFQVKRPEHIALLTKPEPSQWATEMGSKFGQIITSCVSMIDSGGGDGQNALRSAALRLTNEEEPLGNEAQIFFRLESSLVYFKAWVVKRSKVWLNGWAMPQFLAISQREPALLVKLIKSRESIFITREFLLNHEDISIRLSAKHRNACADDLKTAVLNVQAMCEELLQSVGPVCSTLSSATLQSNMPSTRHWRGVGGRASEPERPSYYVNIFIGIGNLPGFTVARVIAPVITASVELVPGPVQEAMGKQVVNAACEAWLQYILRKKIHFSEWGAVQLLRDFTAFREWIRTETELEREARKAILQLEILKTCEGVAYLLLRNPGDILGVGKQQQPSRKNRRVAPMSADSVESSPGATDSSEDDIPAEMYVPNQQMWLELRLRRGYFTPPCC